MGERSTHDGPLLPRRRVSGRGLALAGAALLAAAAPFFIPNPVQASVYGSGADQSQSGRVHMDGGLPPDEPAVENPDLVIEDGEMGKTLTGSLVGFYNRCFSQIASSVHEYRNNTDEIVGPLPNRRVRLSAFNGRINIIGRSTSDNGGAVNFNGDPNKGPALIIQLQSPSCSDNNITATVTKLGEGELSKQAKIPSGRLQRFPFLYTIRR